jgi:hypothetical protein
MFENQRLRLGGWVQVVGLKIDGCCAATRFEQESISRLTF